MKVKLLRDSRITIPAGEVVNISPAQARFLISVNSAVAVLDTAAPTPAPEAKPTKKGGKSK